MLGVKVVLCSSLDMDPDLHQVMCTQVQWVCSTGCVVLRQAPGRHKFFARESSHYVKPEPHNQNWLSQVPELMCHFLIGW